MIDYAMYCKMMHMNQEGLNAAQIAAALAVDVRTVRKWLVRKRFAPRTGARRDSKLDPFKRDIGRLLEAHPYSAMQIYQRICQQGFAGGYTIVKDYVRKVRPVRMRAFLTLAFAPGECAQVDWGSFGTVAVGATVRRLSFFVMVLCYSRMMYVQFTVSQTMEHFLDCHQNAFEYFGAVPKRIMVDNLKSAVLKRIVGQAPVFNPRYLDFAAHCGFDISACNVGKGNEKGRVENGVGYVKKNLLAGLAIPDFTALAPAARHWLDAVANVRIHGETREKPTVLFEKERPCLNRLPLKRYDVATVYPVRATNQFRVAIDTNRYSVPAEYASRALIAKLSPEWICIYHDDRLIARHGRCYDRHQDIEDPDHPKQLLLWRKKAREQTIVMRFLSLSPRAAGYYRKLEQRRMNPYHHVQKIVALSEIYGTEAVARALEDAFVFAAFSCEYIANLLEQRSRKLPQPGALHLTRRQDLLELEVESADLSLYEDNAHE
jgi:transposase